MDVPRHVRTTTIASSNYQVTVQPNAHAPKPKDFIREYWRPFTEFEFDLLQSQSEDPSLDVALDKRCCFRRNRIAAFETKRHFPALLSPRILPSCPRVGEKPRSAASSCRPSCPASRACAYGGARRPLPSQATTNERLIQKTACSSVKQQDKRPPSSERPFRSGDASEARNLISNRCVDFNGGYEEHKIAQRAEAVESKQRWICQASMVPVGRNLRRSHDSVMEAQDRRFSMREKCEALNSRYWHRLRLYQRDVLPLLRKKFYVRSESHESLNTHSVEETPRSGKFVRESMLTSDPIKFLAERFSSHKSKRSAPNNEVKPKELPAERASIFE